ncbi:MAG: hypothetical protein ACRDBG_23090 [Waterburya sp.]
MSHFNAKTLSFYGVAIGSVLLLFKTVSAYGETKLKAPPNIDGSYQFLQAENLPTCLQNQQLKLNVEQSGVYLFGNLAIQPQSGQENVVEIPFNGNFKDNQIIMSGKGNLANCDSEVQLTIQGKHDQENLVGQIKDDSAKTQGTFVAKFEKSKLPSSESEGH